MCLHHKLPSIYRVANSSRGSSYPHVGIVVAAIKRPFNCEPRDQPFGPLLIVGHGLYVEVCMSFHAAIFRLHAGRVFSFSSPTDWYRFKSRASNGSITQLLAHWNVFVILINRSSLFDRPLGGVTHCQPEQGRAIRFALGKKKRRQFWLDYTAEWPCFYFQSAISHPNSWRVKRNEWQEGIHPLDFAKRPLRMQIDRARPPFSHKRQRLSPAKSTRLAPKNKGTDYTFNLVLFDF